MKIKITETYHSVKFAQNFYNSCIQQVISTYTLVGIFKFPNKIILW